MSKLSGLRAGLAGQLDNITGLRVLTYIPDQVNPPMAVVLPRRVDFDSTFARACDEYTFDVQVIVHRPSERSGQTQLDDYCDAAGTVSVKTAIEADPTLGGSAQTCRVTEVSSINAVDIGEVTYLQATFTVSILA